MAIAARCDLRGCALPSGSARQGTQCFRLPVAPPSSYLGDAANSQGRTCTGKSHGIHGIRMDRYSSTSPRLAPHEFKGALQRETIPGGFQRDGWAIGVSGTFICGQRSRRRLRMTPESVGSSQGCRSRRRQRRMPAVKEASEDNPPQGPHGGSPWIADDRSHRPRRRIMPPATGTQPSPPRTERRCRPPVRDRVPPP